MTTAAPPEERVVLRRVRWDTYERLVADHEDARSPRFTYDRRVLEIVSPGDLHESISQLVTSMSTVIAETRDLDMTALGSTTFKDAGWDRGFEPDACSYLGGLTSPLPRWLRRVRAWAGVPPPR